MDVRCERCNTEYEFDDSRVTARGISVKCTSCGHMFKVRSAEASAGPAFGPDGVAVDHDASRPHSRHWMVRQANGNIFTFRDLSTLQKWVLQGKVARDDEISRSGSAWRRLATIGELGSFFQVQQSQPGSPTPWPEQSPPAPFMRTQSGNIAPAGTIPGAAGAASATGSGPYSTGTSPPMSANDPAWAGFDDGQQRRRTMSPPAPGEGPSAHDAFGDFDGFEDWVDEARLRRNGRVAWAGVIVLFVLALSVGYLYLFQPIVWHQIMGSETPPAIAHRVSPSAPMVAPPPAAPTTPTPEPAAVAKPAPGETKSVDAKPGDGAAKAPAPAPPKPAAKPKAKPKAPRGYDGLMRAARRELMRGGSMRALSHYESAARANQRSPEPLAGMGWAYINLHKPHIAVVKFKQALSKSDRYGDAYIGLGKAYRMMDKNGEAIRYYRRYVDIHPRGPSASIAKSALDRLKP